MRVKSLVAVLALAAAVPALAQQQPAQTGSGAEGADQTAAAPIEFRTILGDKPIEIAADQVTPAFEEFRRTGQNPFSGDEAALAEGKKVYAKLCQACHLPTGEGRIGPSLRDDEWRHPSLETQAGRFSIIHSGGAGAMQPFHNRIGIDDILKVMAYIDTFRTD